MKLTHLRKWGWSRPVISLLICGCVFLVFFIFRRTGGLEIYELRMYDLWLRWQWKDDRPATPIFTVNITDDDFNYRQERGVSDWITDAELAKLIRLLQEQGAKAIGIDLVRPHPVPDPNDPHGSQALDEVLTKEGSNVVVIGNFHASDGKVDPPPAVVGAAAQLAAQDPWPKGLARVGAPDIPPDRDRIVRRAFLLLNPKEDDNESYGSFALELASIYLQREAKVAPDEERVRLDKAVFEPFHKSDGGYVDEDDKGYTFLLDYRGRPGASRLEDFPSCTMMSLLHPNQSYEKQIRGSVVIIGRTSSIEKDFFSTALDGVRYGLDIHAMAVDQIVRAAKYGGRPYVRVLNDGIETIWILIWSLLGGLVGLTVRRPLHFSSMTIGGLALLPVGGWLAFNYGWWIPVVPPALTFFTSAAFVTAYVAHREREDRRVIETLFRKHVDDEVVGMLMDHRDEFTQGGKMVARRITATVLFTDMKGFSTLSETQKPEVLMPWLNDYMEVMSSLVDKHGGLVNKYIGDAIMAVFGAPAVRTTEEEFAEDARNAVRCALAMRSELLILNAKWKAKKLPTTGMRVGIHTGELVAGSLGSAQRLEYTVIGDTVNIAARLEGHDKENIKDADISANDCRILIGQSTHQRLNGEFATREIGLLTLHNMKHQVTVYGVVG